MTIDLVTFEEGEAVLDWLSVARAIEEGHRRPRAILEDVILRRGPDTLLNRSAWIDGLGIAVKAATVFPGNAAKGKPTVGGAVNLMSDEDGTLEAIIDFALVTKWKTAGDSLLGAQKLARPDLHYADDDGARYHTLFSNLAPRADVTLLTTFDRDSAKLFPDLVSRATPPSLANVRTAFTS